MSIIEEFEYEGYMSQKAQEFFKGKGIAEKDWVTFESWYNETFKSE
jgi:hypothetical protein